MIQPKKTGFGKTPSSNTGSKCHNCITTIQTDVSSSGVTHVTTKSTTSVNGVTNTTPITSATDNTSNTGIDLVQSIDWFQFTIKFASFKQFEQCIDFVVGYADDTAYFEPGKVDRKGIIWKNSGGSAKGIRFWWNEPSPETGEIGGGMVGIPSSVLSQMSVENIWRMMTGLLNVYSVKCTRIDIAIDDYSKGLPIDEIEKALLNGNFTGFRKPRKVDSLEKDGSGFTYYLGSRKSDKFVRIYDKSYESKGKLDCWRIEGEFKDERASEIFKQYAQFDRESFETIGHKYLAGVLFGSFDFIDRENVKRASRSERKRASRSERLPWWDKVVNMISRIKISLPRPTKSTDRQDQTLKKQWAPSLLVRKKALGSIRFRFWLEDILNAGENRLNASHEAMIEQIRMENGIANELRENIFCSI